MPKPANRTDIRNVIELETLILSPTQSVALYALEYCITIEEGPVSRIAKLSVIAGEGGIETGALTSWVSKLHVDRPSFATNGICGCSKTKSNPSNADIVGYGGGKEVFASKHEIF